MNNLKQKTKMMPLEEMRQSLLPDWSSIFSRGAFGALDIDKGKEEITISVDLPGVQEEDIDLSYEDNRLLLRASRQEEQSSQDDGYYHAERTWGEWERSLYLPGIDPDSIAATLSDGVLTLSCSLPERKGKHIEIAKK